MDAKTLLKTHKLRHTESREEILSLFLMHQTALSQPEIEKAITVCDRVTIYRTLTAFLENGILHKVLEDAGAMRYALCKTQHCSEHTHHHDHVHFKCEDCGDTTCVEEVKILVPTLPSGFKVKESNLLIQGVCPKCNNDYE